MSTYIVKQKVWDFPVPPPNSNEDFKDKPWVCIIKENGYTYR